MWKAINYTTIFNKPKSRNQTDGFVDVYFIFEQRNVRQLNQAKNTLIDTAAAMQCIVLTILKNKDVYPSI